MGNMQYVSIKWGLYSDPGYHMFLRAIGIKRQALGWLIVYGLEPQSHNRFSQIGNQHHDKTETVPA
jgi:hypothetical protein